MRIVSSFHDYYDSVQATGQDQSLVYVREKVDLPKGSPRPQLPQWRQGWRDVIPSQIAYSHVVGFCGKLYAVFQLGIPSRIAEAPPRFVFCPNMEAVDKYVSQHGNDADHDYYAKPTIASWHYKRYRGGLLSINRRRTEAFFSECAAAAGKFDSAFAEFDVPIFRVSCRIDGRVGAYAERIGGFVLNPCLRDIDFFRVLDPFTAFQELQMWLSNLARPIKEAPVPSDKIMAEIKGFNKWSFRKEPTKKR